jgi:hypothetical protein
MAKTIIEAVRQLHITPLVTIQHPEFGKQYERGLGCSLFDEHKTRGHLHDLYLADTFTLARRFGRFDDQYEQHLYAHIGFTLGEIHSGVLLPNGSVRPDVTSLIAFDDQDTKRGYQSGREFYFTDADTEAEWHRTDEFVIEHLRELALEYDLYKDAQRTVRYCIGGILGELSGRLFPWTREEQRAIEESSTKHLGYVCRINPQSIAARQFCVQAVS